MIVISDASPLIGLAVTGHLDLLKHLYERVIIPEAVYQELAGNDIERPGAAEVRTLEWIISQPVQNEIVVRALEGELDHGEATAIALVVELQADLVPDRRAARTGSGHSSRAQCGGGSRGSGRGEAQGSSAAPQTDPR
jgi:predicted nucleic acid-binding protein